MKLSKAQLKILIKECLVEILNEGLGGAIATSMDAPGPRTAITDAPRRPTVGESRRRPYNPNPALDEPVRPRNATPASSLLDAVKIGAGGNSVMAEILADTAATTFQTIGNTLMAGGAPAAAAHAGAVGAVERMVEAHDPEELFGSDAMNKWADLAFNSPSLKKST